MKVFVSGSKTLGKLNYEMKAKLKEFADAGYEILIGDCHGVDVAVQMYYSEIGYNNISVYVSGDKVRNNFGNNKVIHISVDERITGYEFYKQKDIAMANDADCGFVIWDGKTKGTQRNIEDLKKQGKHVMIFTDEKKDFYMNNGVYTEGYLGDEKKCDILFVLREPDTDGKKADIFWFKQVVNGVKFKGLDVDSKKKARIANASGTRYKNVLGRIASKLLNITSENYEEVLKNCCYMNVCPESGEKQISLHYKVNDDYRKALIKRIIEEHNTKFIVTVSDVFDKLCGATNESWLTYEDKNFRKGKYEGVEVYEFYHPSSTKIKYKEFDKSLERI